MSHFELQPTLTGERVLLRPLDLVDFDALYDVARDPLIWAQHPASDRWQEPVLRAFFAEAMASGGAFATVDRASGRIVGSTRYFGYDATASEVEIGWTFLERAYWGTGFNAEVKRLMLDHAFRFVGRVVFLVGPGNIRSQRALERIGAERCGKRQDATGRVSLVYEIRREG